jgi:hypothetical protein
MSTLRRDIYRKKLRSMLSMADDRDFIVMCWAARSIQSGFAAAASPYLNFPREAVTRSLTDIHSIYPWYIETLINELFITFKAPNKHRGNDRILNCATFAAIAAVRNVLRELENAEDGIVLQRANVLREMHRLAQRQFEWKRGFLSMPQLYRAGFLNGGEHTEDYFQRSVGCSVTEFSHATFGITAVLHHRPALPLDADLTGANLTRALTRQVLEHISLPIDQARIRAAQLRSNPGHVGYKKSVLRTHPCIIFGNEVIAPLPELISLRGLNGIFYDVVTGPEAVKNEISARFEKYCLDFMSPILTDMQIDSDVEYRRGTNLVRSPDLLLSRNGRLSVIIECKATRMTYEARFGEDPLVESARGYAEMAKGVFQIWRFVSHIRRGYLPQITMSDGICGLVVTLDSWLSMAGLLIEDVIASARTMAAESDRDITAIDQIPVRFCMVDDLENTLSSATTDSFLGTIIASTSEEHRGWLLTSVHDQFFGAEQVEERDFPLADRMHEVQGDWWKQMDENAKKRGIVRTGRRD